MRRETFENTKFGREGAPVIHIHFVLAGPMKGLSFDDLQSLEIDLMLFIEIQIFFREIISDHPNHFYWSKKTCSNGCMAGASAEKSWVFRIRCFDRIKCSRTNY